VSYAPKNLGDVDRDPDIIFIESPEALAPAQVAMLTARFPKKTYVALAEASEEERAAYLAQGLDEVMSLAELDSSVGRHLFDKLLALKALAAAEMRIEQSEERFRGIIEHSLDIIMLLDEDGTIVYTSPAFGRQLGYESWEVLGQPFWDLLHKEDRAQVESSLKILMSAWANDGMAFEYRFLRKDGEWRSFETVATNLLRTDPVRALVLNSRDVTRQKQTEIELEKYRLHLEELVVSRTREAEEANRRADWVIAASPDALIALDDEGRITFISEHYKTIYPASIHALAAGKHILEVWDMVARESGMSPDDEVYKGMAEWFARPHGAKEFRRHNGSWVRLHVRKRPGEPGIVISTTDISGYKRQQALLAAQSAELKSSLEKEKELAEQQRTFISMVSHEFRTPLTIIDGNAQIIGKRGDTLGREMLEKRTGTIRAAVDRLVRLIETVLSAHMMEMGRLNAEPAPCNLEKLVRDVCSDQQDVSPEHKIKVSIQNLPPVMVFDEKLIRQTVTNLVSNAVKYSPQSRRIEVEAAADAKEAVIRVRDYGVGIPEAEMPRMFQKYYRASTSGGIPGSGLGLSLVKQFVELHNGTIGLESRVGEGTVVTVKLPVVLEGVH
jgi:PAS domain S-box-containing protein